MPKNSYLEKTGKYQKEYDVLENRLQKEKPYNDNDMDLLFRSMLVCYEDFHKNGGRNWQYFRVKVSFSRLKKSQHLFLAETKDFDFNNALIEIENTMESVFKEEEDKSLFGGLFPKDNYDNDNLSNKQVKIVSGLYEKIADIVTKYCYNTQYGGLLF